MKKIFNLPNIGIKIEKQLLEVGINSEEELKKIGSKQAWLNIQKIDDTACYNRLCALEGAIRNVRHHYLPKEVKDELKEFYKINIINKVIH